MATTDAQVCISKNFLHTFNPPTLPKYIRQLLLPHRCALLIITNVSMYITTPPPGAVLRRVGCGTMVTPFGYNIHTLICVQCYDRVLHELARMLAHPSSWERVPRASRILIFFTLLRGGSFPHLAACNRSSGLCVARLPGGFLYVSIRGINIKNYAYLYSMHSYPASSAELQSMLRACRRQECSCA